MGAIITRLRDVQQTKRVVEWVRKPGGVWTYDVEETRARYSAHLRVEKLGSERAAWRVEIRLHDGQRDVHEGTAITVDIAENVAVRTLNERLELHATVQRRVERCHRAGWLECFKAGWPKGPQR